MSPIWRPDALPGSDRVLGAHVHSSESGGMEVGGEGGVGEESNGIVTSGSQEPRGLFNKLFFPGGSSALQRFPLLSLFQGEKAGQRLCPWTPPALRCASPDPPMPHGAGPPCSLNGPNTV